MSHKLRVALAAYAVLALLIWFTLDQFVIVGGRVVPLRAVVLAVVGLFLLKTLLHWKRQRIEETRETRGDLR